MVRSVVVGMTIVEADGQPPYGGKADDAQSSDEHGDAVSFEKRHGSNLLLAPHDGTADCVPNQKNGTGQRNRDAKVE